MKDSDRERYGRKAHVRFCEGRGKQSPRLLTKFVWICFGMIFWVGCGPAVDSISEDAAATASPGGAASTDPTSTDTLPGPGSVPASGVPANPGAAPSGGEAPGNGGPPGGGGAPINGGDPTISGSADTVVIKLNTPRQSVDGVGFCHEGDRMNGDNYVIDAKIQGMLDNKMSLFRDMFPNRSWEPSNDDGDANNINWSGFKTEDSRVQNSFKRLKEMQNRGIITILGIWDVPNWLVSNSGSGGGRKINNFDEFAEMMTAFLLWGKTKYDLTVNFIDVNESMNGGGVNLKLSPQEYITFIQKCSAKFTANGLTTKVNIGSDLLWSEGELKTVFDATKSIGGYPSMHSYRGGSLTTREPEKSFTAWGTFRQAIDKNLWCTETDYDAFYYNNAERNNYTGVEEMAVMYWRLYYLSRASTTAGWYWWDNVPSHNVHRAYMNHFAPGGWIVEASQPSSNINVLAYKNPTQDKFVLQLVNQNTTAIDLNFVGVPANKPLTLIRTSNSGDRYTTVGTFNPVGDKVTIQILGDSFNTFYGQLGAYDVDP